MRKPADHDPVTEMETATRAAMAAGKLLLEAFAMPHQENHKAPRNIVTEMDLSCEDLLRRMLCDPFPTYGFLGEESHGTDGQSKDATWIVDPLDGTTNYARGYPLFAVSIALMKRGQLTLGVVFNPMRDELFSAERGRGATLNTRPIRVTETGRLEDALLASGFPYEAATNPRNNSEEIELFIRRTRSVRVDGAASIDLAHVAAGRLDGYWEAGLSPWDMAAGAVIAKEAGATVTLQSGEPFAPFEGSVIACNPALHTQMLAVLRLRA
jgi:myo-inositol-1(or 4)-monophosphatase